MDSPWTEFTYEVNRATVSLMYLLRGMELVRSNESHSQYDQEKFVRCFPRLPYVDAPPFLQGIPSDLNELLKREGEAEQLAFKGWVEQVFNSTWDSRLRNHLRDRFEKHLGDPNIISPETDVLGDLRYIRNDLVHDGKASRQWTGKCKVLKWFVLGDRIILGMRHVFDFLNQMGFMSMRHTFRKFGGTIVWWGLLPDIETTLESKSIPKLVSLRTFVDDRLEGAPYAISVVFENGVFVNLAIDTMIDVEFLTELSDDLSAPEKIRLIYEKKMVYIDGDGNVRFADGGVIDRERLYRKAIDVLSGKEPTIEHSMGIPGPWFKLKDPP